MLFFHTPIKTVLTRRKHYNLLEILRDCKSAIKHMSDVYLKEISELVSSVFRENQSFYFITSFHIKIEEFLRLKEGYKCI